MAVINEHIHPLAQSILHGNHIGDFESLWNLTGEVVEQGNIGRGGWSRVEKTTLRYEGVTHTFYIKKQQNYHVRMASHFFAKIPTLLKESIMIKKFHQAQIPTLELAYFGWRKQDDDHQAILITWELKDYIPLDVCLENWLQYSFKQRRDIITTVAGATKHMHDHHVMHNCLYPKHIFLKLENDKILVAFIDLEKSKWIPCESMIFNRDIDSLNRRASKATQKAKLYFLHDYFGEAKLSSVHRKKCAHLIAPGKRKG